MVPGLRCRVGRKREARKRRKPRRGMSSGLAAAGSGVSGPRELRARV